MTVAMNNPPADLVQMATLRQRQRIILSGLTLDEVESIYREIGLVAPVPAEEVISRLELLLVALKEDRDRE